ncbi:hypothetical protein [Paracoccus sp. DMF]|uniref:hypothetical protein n=1 Tax=Paracoccus sp. DMF TaxID=400837 RepID=UPI0021E3D424|nr:hypothetical protein [Paracoccus sp. DMF]MCV2446150.1 hypothetical protein [Paracoccus sp. DMF]
MRYRDIGIARITLGDTTGMATPGNVLPALDALRKAVPEVAIALHFHNTRGVGLACAYAGLLHGIRDFEASVGGIGGCQGKMALTRAHDPRDRSISKAPRPEAPAPGARIKSA